MDPMIPEMSRAKQGHVVLIPCPYQGHLSPILQLGAVLHYGHGFSVTIAHTSFNFPRNCPPPFHFISIPDHLSDDDVSSNNFIDIALKLNVNCKAPLRDLLGHFVERGRSEAEASIACIIYDGIMYFSEEVAEELGIPSMSFRTLCAGNVRIYKEYPRLIEEGHIPVQGTRVPVL